MSSPTSPKPSLTTFYAQWKGHPLSILTALQTTSRTLHPTKPIIYLAGDSSLDNKAWVTTPPTLPVPIPQIYKHVFKDIDTRVPKPDVAFWLNHFLGERATCINAAVEESLLRERDNGLLEHDEFIRDNISERDVLILSVGANDIALNPTQATMWHMLRLSWLTRLTSIASGTASSLPYFHTLFKDKTETYISRLTAKCKPRLVIVCMIYYPLESGLGQSSWADASLKALGYEGSPGKLQAAIKRIYKDATEQVKVQGTRVVACPLFEVLDGKRVGEYAARVEPSAEGGRRMAERFAEMVRGVLGEG